MRQIPREGVSNSLKSVCQTRLRPLDRRGRHGMAIGAHHRRDLPVPPRRPVLTVLSPRLVPPEGMKLKHVFAGDHPWVRMHHDWNPSMSIATTIVPWLSESLLHYEVYRATGKWTGGGHEPGPRRGYCVLDAYWYAQLTVSLDRLDAPSRAWATAPGSSLEEERVSQNIAPLK